jgi:hypothetical protein
MSELATTNVGISRRKILIGSACMAAAASLPAVTTAATAKQSSAWYWSLVNRKARHDENEQSS